MDKSLICKIVVNTAAGKKIRGTGYAIGRDRIVTAAHVVESAADQPHAIELHFGESNQRHAPNEPPTVYRNWNDPGNRWKNQGFRCMNSANNSE